MTLIFHFAGKSALFAVRLEFRVRDFGNDSPKFLRSSLLIWSGPSALFTSNLKIVVLISLGETYRHLNCDYF